MFFAYAVLHHATLLAFFMTTTEIMPIMARKTGDMSRQVTASPPHASTSPMYGVPRNAPMFSAESVMLEARNERWGGTCL